MPGIKHLIECHCYLAIYKKHHNPVNHKFPVYSKVDEDGVVVKKNVKCNNCDAFHFVYDLCKSEIKAGKDQSNLIITKDDLSTMQILLVGYKQRSQFDIDRWLIGLDMAGAKVQIFEIPVLSKWFPLFLRKKIVLLVQKLVF